MCLRLSAAMSRPPSPTSWDALSRLCRKPDKTKKVKCSALAPRNHCCTVSIIFQSFSRHFHHRHSSALGTAYEKYSWVVKCQIINFNCCARKIFRQSLILEVRHKKIIKFLLRRYQQIRPTFNGRRLISDVWYQKSDGANFTKNDCETF